MSERAWAPGLTGRLDAAGRGDARRRACGSASASCCPPTARWRPWIRPTATASYFALRGHAVLAPRGSGRLRRRVRGVVRAGRPEHPRRRPVLDEVAAAGAARASAVPGRARPAEVRARGRGGARRMVGRRAAARQGLRRVHATRSAGWRAPVMRRLAASAPARPSRRTRRARRRGATASRRAARPAPHHARLAAHRTAIRSSATGASPASARARWCWSATCRARWSPTRGCCSQYMQACVAARRRVEAFVFGTRLTRVTARAARAATPTAPWSARPRAARRLVGRHAHRRGARHAQPRARPPARARRGRGAAFRRLGSRRAGAAGARDGAAGALLAPADLAQSAQGPPGLRAADARDAGRAAARGPLPGRELACLARGAGRGFGPSCRMGSLRMEGST